MPENEHQLKLFDRANSGYALTAACVALAAKSDVVRDAKGEAERVTAASESQGVASLIITAPIALVLNILGPIVSRFADVNSEIEIRLHSDERLVSLPGREADIAIRTSNSSEDHLVGH